MESHPVHLRQALVLASPHIYQEQLSLEAASLFLSQQVVAIRQIISVETLDGLPPLAGLWRKEGIDLVIAAGGDGTVGAAATHLAHSTLPLGILPLCTSNDFARALSIPLDLAEACRMIATGHQIQVDLGCADPAVTAPHALQEAATHLEENAAPPEKLRTQAYFTHALTLGLNVAFAQLATDATLRQRLGRFTYPLAAVETLSTSQLYDFTLRFNYPVCALTPEETENDIEAEHPYHYQALQVAVINTPVFVGP